MPPNQHPNDLDDENKKKRKEKKLFGWCKCKQGKLIKFNLHMYVNESN